MPQQVTRRHFLGSVTAATTILAAPIGIAASPEKSLQPYGGSSALDILRKPDNVTAHFGFRRATPLQYAGHEWTCLGVQLTAEPSQNGHELPLRLRSPGGELTHVHLRWHGRGIAGLSIIGDHWERSYGDLEWRGVVPDRVMPWYFLTFDGKTTNGYGVKTQPSAFCFWMADSQGISLWIDLRNGGGPASLGNRELAVCTVVTRAGGPEESSVDVARKFCKQMCPKPRLPEGAIFGTNDWNYAYGRNSTDGTLRDADLIASLAPKGKSLPYIVIDDGWQDRTRFPSLPDLAMSIRNRKLHPGIWVRPLRAPETTPKKQLLPLIRFGSNSERNDLAFDPTNPEALTEIMRQISVPSAWGFEFIKHDFSTYELFGRWGSEMGAQVTSPGWHFQDETLTNAEIVSRLYEAIRKSAGEDRIVLGCNTIGHLATGHFDSQRVADDTSGREWERTRRFGINGLAHRLAQHRTFSHVDADCAAITPVLDWKLTKQWIDVVARSGTSLFFSPDPRSITVEVKAVMKEAMAIVSGTATAYPVMPTESTTPDIWEDQHSHSTRRQYNWTPDAGTFPLLVT